MRVANEVRAWQQGKVLFFDDSFEHEVRNRCDESFGPRAVFQLVIAHPDLPVTPRTAATLGAAGERPKRQRKN